MRSTLVARAPHLVRALVVALLVVVLVAVTTGASGEKAGGVVRDTLAGEDVRLTLPTGDAKPKGLAIYFHGQGGNVNDKIDGPFIGALLRDGWAIASGNLHAESWGSPVATESAGELVAWAEQQTGIPTTLWISGSMGGTTSLNALLHGVEPPDCWYGVKPAIALTELDRVLGANRNMALAYGGPVPDERNPVRNIADLPDDLRYRVVASPDDELVDLRLNAGALISELTQRGLDITYHLVTGPHEDPSHFDPDDLLAFGTYCLGDGESPPSDTPPSG